MRHKYIVVICLLSCFTISSTAFISSVESNEVKKEIEENVEPMLLDTYLENYNCKIMGNVRIPLFRFRRLSFIHIMQDIYMGTSYYNEYGNRQDSPEEGTIWTNGTYGVVSYTGDNIFGQLGKFTRSGLIGFFNIYTRYYKAIDDFRGICVGTFFIGVCSHVKIGTRPPDGGKVCII